MILMKYNLKNFQDDEETKEAEPVKRRFMKRPAGKFVFSMLYTWFIAGVISLFLLYGPWDWFRATLITSTQTTINHKYISNIFYSQKTIDKVMSKNTVIDLDTQTDTNSIKTNKNGDTVKLTNISKSSYNAWMLEISDPAEVMLGVSKYFGVKGQKLPYLMSNYSNALAGINAGGFGDASGFGNGGIPMGLVISEGEALYMPNKSTYNIIGFNKDNILILGNFRKGELDGLKLRDAIEFTPFLIINGEAAKITGNGGWGLAPRTAIGQRKDGTVVFVVVDGRSVSSAGVTIKTLQNIMIEQNCYNAANLDGGSSTVLHYDGKVINNPSGSDSDGMRFLPNAFLVLDK